MALLTLRSTNPNLSYVLSKNPASGLLVRGVRLGTLYGWFPPGDPQTYAIWFRDSDTEVSYKLDPDQEFEYLDTTRYSSPMAPVNMIAELLRSASSKRHEQDAPGHANEATINLFNCTRQYIEIFQRSFPDFALVATEVAPKHYRIVVQTQRPVHDLLNYISLFGLFSALKLKMPVDAKMGAVACPACRGAEGGCADCDHTGEVHISPLAEKYIGVINVLDAPYLVRYAFKANLLRYRPAFEKYRGALEATKRGTLALTYGSTTDARQDFVRAALGTDKLPILDVGCGEGSYARLFAPRIEPAAYLAVDTNPERIEDVRKLAARKQLENVRTFASLDSALASEPAFKTEPHNVLMVEVLEHMTKEQAATLVQRVLAEVKVNKLIITTPNKPFGVHFGFEDGEERHDDHHFEFESLQQLENFLKPLLCCGATLQVQPLGDQVDGVPMGLAAVVSKSAAEAKA